RSEPGVRDPARCRYPGRPAPPGLDPAHKKEDRHARHAVAQQQRRFASNLLDDAAMLEDKGMLVEAAQMYQRALSKEPQHMQLRHYLNQLNNRINQQAVAHKAAERQQEYQQHLAGEANKANLQLAAHEREPPLRRGRVMPGGHTRNMQATA
ncbi:hypothetical protein HaLaN_32362, partial [Haematococcus lacustris]